jgi:hypothetical protein
MHVCLQLAVTSLPLAELLMQSAEVWIHEREGLQGVL